MPAALLALLASLLQSASPQIIGIITEWLGRYKEALHNEDPQLVLDLEKTLAGGDLHALSVLSLRLYNRVGADPAGESGDPARYQDRLSPGGPAVAGSNAPAVPGPSGPHG